MELTLGRPCLQDGFPFIDLHVEHKHQITSELGKIKAYLKSLEEERHKIKAFRRELPICMQLLRNEIEASRERLSDCKNDDTFTLFENSPPLKAHSTMLPEVNSTNTEPNNCQSLVGDGSCEAGPRLQTSSWLRDEVDEDQEVISAIASKLYKARSIERSEKDFQLASSHVLGRRPGGAFVPFLKDGMRKPLDEAAEEASLPHAHHQDAYLGPYFSASPQEVPFPTANEFGTFSSTSDGASHQEINEPFPPAAAVIANNGSASQTLISPHRKPRRCWSTELHHKFVNALKQLGGSEVATPKQIRELMQVDGLTNDEIKSHLQKYRLHRKRPNPTSLHADAMHIPKGTPQLVLLGGLWVPPEYPLKQGIGHSLYVTPFPHLMDQTLTTQGRPLFDQNPIHTQQHASTH